MIAYQQGETVPEEAKFYDRDDNLIDVDTLITIKDPTGTIVDGPVIMVHESLGTYTYNYDLATDASLGLWKIIVRADSASVISIRNDAFRVVH